MKLNKKELLFLRNVIRDVDGAFDMENNETDDDYKRNYDLTKSEIIAASQSLMNKVLAELSKFNAHV